jgi:hypothetical protein
LSLDDSVWAIGQIRGTMRPAAASLTAFDPACDPSARALDGVVATGLALLDAARRV